eukprot:m.64060 g.64060  ORF g.64060 m.64060 type:complete len:62 (+) comp7497_c0_seq1:3542-3727(+)
MTACCGLVFDVFFFSTFVLCVSSTPSGTSQVLDFFFPPGVWWAHQQYCSHSMIIFVFSFCF